MRSGTRKIRAIGQQHAEDEDDERGVQREQQLQQAAQNANSGMSHSVGDGRAHAERRHVHDEVGELEHRLRQALAEGQHGTALRLADHGQGDGENQAEDHDLQHRAVGDRLGDVLGKDVQDGVFGAEFADREVSVLVVAGS